MSGGYLGLPDAEVSGGRDTPDYIHASQGWESLAPPPAQWSYRAHHQATTHQEGGVAAIISPILLKGSQKLKYIASHSLPTRLAEEPLLTRLARLGRDPKRKETKMKREKLQNKRNAEIKSYTATETNDTLSARTIDIRQKMPL